MATVSVSSSLVRAALDTTKPKLRYNPNAPRNVKINPNSTTSFVPPSSSPAVTVLTTTSVSVSDLLKRPASKGDDEDSCVGYVKWFPSPPKVKKPRSVFNAASLAYIGDSIYEDARISYDGYVRCKNNARIPNDDHAGVYTTTIVTISLCFVILDKFLYKNIVVLGCKNESNSVDTPSKLRNHLLFGFVQIYARRHFLFPPLSIEEYNDRVRAVVRCEAQYALLHNLLDEDFLTKDEREILRWGKNVGSVKTRSTRRAGVAVYNKASSLETLIGYLYLANGKRLEEIMQKLGFSSGSSTEIMVKEAKHKLSSLK
ncbi:hypothetical protein Bca4012_008257 [Brassica carinata]